MLLVPLLMKSTDGGQTWNDVAVRFNITFPEFVAWQDVHFIDEMNGWAIFMDIGISLNLLRGWIMKTTDGGANWTDVTSLIHPVQYYTYPLWVTFVDALTGYIGWMPSGAPGIEIWKTTNGGTSWTHITDFIYDSHGGGLDVLISKPAFPTTHTAAQSVRYTTDTFATVLMEPSRRLNWYTQGPTYAKDDQIWYMGVYPVNGGMVGANHYIVRATGAGAACTHPLLATNYLASTVSIGGSGSTVLAASVKTNAPYGGRLFRSTDDGVIYTDITTNFPASGYPWFPTSPGSPMPDLTRQQPGIEALPNGEVVTIVQKLAAPMTTKTFGGKTIYCNPRGILHGTGFGNAWIIAWEQLFKYPERLFRLSDTIMYVYGRQEPPPPPIADARSTSPIHRGDLETLDGSHSSDPGHAPLTYLWTQTAGPAVILSDPTAENPTFTPTSLGTYTFSLVVNNGVVSSPSSSTSVIVENIRPIAIPTADVTYGIGHLSVTFTSGGSYDPDGTVVSWQWNFGDGTGNLVAQNTTHLFAHPGVYTVTLTVKDNDNAWSLPATLMIIVDSYRPPDPSNIVLTCDTPELHALTIHWTPSQVDDLNIPSDPKTFIRYEVYMKENDSTVTSSTGTMVACSGPGWNMTTYKPLTPPTFNFRVPTISGLPLKTDTTYSFVIYLVTHTSTGSISTLCSRAEGHTLEMPPTWDPTDTFDVTNDALDDEHRLDCSWGNKGALAAPNFDHWEMGYYQGRLTDPSPIWIPITDPSFVDKHTVAYIKDGLTPDTWYTFRLRMVSPTGLTSDWMSDEGKTRPVDLWPNAVTLEASTPADPIGEHTLRLNWNQMDPASWADPWEYSTYGPLGTAYRIYYTKTAPTTTIPLETLSDTHPGMSGCIVGPVEPLAVIQADVSGLSPETTYYFALLTCDCPWKGEKRTPAEVEAGHAWYHNDTWAKATTLPLPEPPPPPELTIHYVTYGMSDDFSMRVLEVLPGDRVFLTGTILDDATWDVFVLRDLAPFISGTVVPGDDSLYNYGGQIYPLSEGYYLGSHIGTHAGAPLIVADTQPWASVTMDLARTFSPLAYACRYPVGSGFAPNNLQVISSTKVSLEIPSIFSPEPDPVNYIVIRAKRNRPLGSDDYDYDFVVLKYGAPTTRLATLPILQRMAPKETFNASTDNPNTMQLADTSPKPNLPDPGSAPVWPRFCITDESSRGQTEWFCNYLKPDAVKYLQLQITVGDSDIYCGDVSYPADITIPGIRWRINDGPWTMDYRFFAPEFSPTGVVPGAWPGSLHDARRGDGLAGGSGESVLMAIKLIGTEDLLEENRIVIAVTDIDGTVSTVPIILRYRAGHLEIEYAQPGTGGFVITDPDTGESKFVVRAKEPIDARVKIRWVPND